MKASVSCRAPHGRVQVIPSKSVAHRALISAALSDEETKIICNARSKDIEATARVLSSLGAEISEEGGCFLVRPIKNFRDSDLDCGESGSTLRFLIPVAATISKETTFDGKGRLPERPISELLNCLSENGAEYEYNGRLPLKMRGGLEFGRFKISGKVSSQFISGLLFALPRLSGDSIIEICGNLESSKYVEITLDVIKQFGILAGWRGNEIHIKGNQSYISPKSFSVEGDWSNAAFFASLGAFSEEGITCTGMNMKSIQGDYEILSLLERFGANVTENEDSFTVKKGKLCGISIDASEIPDLVPVLSVVASAAEGETVIYNASRLRIKESDRIKTTVKMIKSLGGDIRSEDDSIIIRGRGKLRGGVVDGENDHRIVMSAAIASAICKEPVIITGAEAVEKSYGDFFERFADLGADVSISEE